MSLEDNVKELTLAIQGLTKALEAQTVTISGDPTPNVGKPTIQKPTTQKASVEKPAPAAEPEEAASTTSTATDVEAEDLTGDLNPEVTLTQLAEKFTELVEKDRPAAVALLKEYKLAKVSVADPDLYGEIYVKVTELLNG